MSRQADYSPARVLLRAADQHPKRLSLVWGYEGQEWTVRDSAQAVRRLASLLAPLISAGERIAIIGPNSPWHFLLHTAAAWHFGVTVPLSPRLPRTQLQSLLDDCQPTLIVTTPEIRATLESSAHSTQAIAHNGQTNANSPQAPSASNTLSSTLNDTPSNAAEFLDEAAAASNCDAPPPLVWTFEELAQRCAQASPHAGMPPACSTELAAIVYTSGSSGTPRGVTLSHENLWWGSMSFRDGFEYSPGTDVIGVCAPLSHIGGFNGTTLDAFTHGGTLVVLPGFEPVSVLRSIERYQITQMFLVPVMCHLLADAQVRVKANLSSYRNPLIGGDYMGVDVERRLRLMGLSPIHVWGMTETAGAGAMLSADMYDQHPGAIGRPFPYIDLRLVDTNGHLVTCPNTLGEIHVSGPGVCSGYYNRPQDTHQSFDGDWLRTGDLATYDSQGFVHMVGRASRMIHTAGEIVPPRRVEDALRSCPQIADALIVGIDDERWGQTVAALLLPTTDAITTDASITDAITNEAATSEPATNVPTTATSEPTSSEPATTTSGAAHISAEEHGLPRLATIDELATLRQQTSDYLASWEYVRKAIWVAQIPTTSTGKPNPHAAHDMLVSVH